MVSYLVFYTDVLGEELRCSCVRIRFSLYSCKIDVSVCVNSGLNNETFVNLEFIKLNKRGNLVMLWDLICKSF